MKEPILSREEVLKIVRKTLKENNDRDKLSSARFVDLATAIEAAILDRVCGEPAAWMVLAANTGLPCEVTLHKSETEALRQDCVIPLYAINRSKS